MAAGSIVVDLLMRTGAFETDTDRAGKKLKAFGKDARSAASDFDFFAGVAKGAIAGVAAAIAGGAITSAFKDAVNGLDALNDAADATGASIENLSALEDVARRNGEGLDVATGALIKFNKELGSAKSGDTTDQILKRIGLSAEELKAIDPAEALRQTAVALSKFADDGFKARVVQELFGKSIKEAGPFLKDLAEQGSLNAKVMTEQARAAEEFNKNIFSLQKDVTDLARELAGPLITSLNKVAVAVKSYGSVTAALKDNFRFDLTADIPGNLAKSFQEAEKLRARLAKIGQVEQRDNLSDPVRARYAEERKELTAQLELLKRRDKYLYAMGADPRGGASELARRGAFSGSIGGIPEPEKADKAVREQANEAEKYLQSLRSQLDATKELSVYEKLLSDLRSGKFKGQEFDLLPNLILTAKQVDANKALAKSEEERARAADEAARRESTAFEERRKSVSAAEEVNEQLREEIAIARSGEVAKRAIERARLDSAISIREEARATAELNGADEVQLRLMDEELAKLRERAGLLGQRNAVIDESAKSAKSAADELGMSFQSAFEDAIVDGEKFGDVLKALERDLIRIALRKLVIEPAVNGITGAIKGWGASGGDGTWDIGTWDGNHASGLDYVPYDGYMAKMHKGERIQSAADAGFERRNSGGDMNVQIFNTNGSAVKTERNGNQLKVFIEDVVNKSIGGGGTIASTLKSKGVNLSGNLPRRG